MALVDLVGNVAVVVVPMLIVASLTLVGPRRLSAAVRTYRWRLAAITTPLLLLATVLLVRVMTRDLLGELSRRVIGTYFTGSIFSIEHVLFETNPVVFLQSFQTEALTAYFAFIYVYGYVFLLVFPFIAYFALSEMDDLNTLVVAYTANYAIGLILYTLFIAYGPRNYDPLLFESLLYDAFPDFGYLTHEVNEPTNVFPSLHTSLSMTVLFVAWRTRDKYPLWVPVSAVFAISVALATMYLGIHWFSDVVVGTLLAFLSVSIGQHYTERDIDATVRAYIRRNLEQVRANVGW